MLALYLHIPFCPSKCRYCAFNSQPLPPGGCGEMLIDDYLDALRRELQLAAPAIPAGESLRSIYFGGGTPTILDPSCLCSLLSLSKRYFKWNESIEITVEANPATVTRAGLAELRRAGVNRLSLGAQSFEASELQLLGRVHGVADIYAACRDARAAGFANLSLDLIYGLPGQTVGDWRETLKRALDLHPEHLSAYGLKLEAGTPLAEDVAAGRLPERNEEEDVAMWYETQRVTSAAGFERYEISNYARPGRESRHNLTYWLNQPYLALGAGASGYLRSEAGGRMPEKAETEIGNRKSEALNRGRSEKQAPVDTQQGAAGEKASKHARNSDLRHPASGTRYVRYANCEDVAGYIASVARGELPRAWEEHQTPEQERADTVMMGLRLTGGLDRSAFQRRFGHPFEFFYGSQLAIMERDGLMEESDAAVFLTERGLLLSNWVLAEFI
ncbi:MAG: radical SAM family heme chaperone HemW [Thermacetogeniaceae bacterium]|jgi:oxygen-independent coproporphyrinogen-3 oxidase